MIVKILQTSTNNIVDYCSMKYQNNISNTNNNLMELISANLGLRENIS